MESNFLSRLLAFFKKNGLVSGLVSTLLTLLLTLAICFLPGLFYISSTDEPGSSLWERPVYKEGRWRLSGIYHGDLRRKDMFGVQVDLICIEYGNGKLWAAAGARRSDGVYESFVEGITTQAQFQEAFQSPRWVTLSVPGEARSAGAENCPDVGNPRCHLTRLAERIVPVLLDGDEEFTESASTVFVRTGDFPSHYLYGFLTWDISLGRVIEPGLEGY